ncbi:MAG: DEAD/DEAH box helicase [Proteobacteria bacterium]|nr:DEAD/DEAH box helicase [Pseudomonadota bacterium]
MRAELGAKTGDTVSKLGLSNEGSYPDQIVVDKCWYPLDEARLQETLSLLHSRGLTIGKDVDLGKLIWLRQARNLPFQVIEDIESAAVVRAVHSTYQVSGFVGQLYPYQEDGLAFLQLVASQSLGCILADEMGLGKTVQLIALMQSEANSKRGPSLIVAPATLLENWRRELQQFSPGLSVNVHRGPTRYGSAEKLAAFNVVITSFDTAVRDELLLAATAWNVLAIDEAQNIRNPEAHRTLSIKRLQRRVSIAVTGTPVENRLADLWSISDFALPGLLGSLSDFRAEFDDTSTDAYRLSAIVNPILLRRRVAEVAADLPERIDIPQCIAMTQALAAAYEKVRRQVKEEYGRSAALASLQRLRMFCTHPMLLEHWGADPALLMPKYQRLLEILEEVFSRGEKALVFCGYRRMVDILCSDLPQRFPKTFTTFIDGRTTIAERQAKVDQFSGALGPAVLILNPKAAGTGLNITAANHVIHYNPEWNPAVVDQASARAYRRRQTRRVTVHYLYFADTVEDVMIQRLTSKRGLAGAAVVGHGGEATQADILRALDISPISNASVLE